MTPEEAARILGVGPTTPWDEVRQQYRQRIREHHPDMHAGGDSARAIDIIRAFAILDQARHAHRAGGPARPTPPDRTAPPPPPPVRFPASTGPVPGVARLDGDTLALDAPADEAFRWLAEVAHDIGEITYVDRSVPILEVLCSFEGEPATSLVLTLQGRMDRTDVFCHVESIEARPGPPTAAVVDVLEHAFAARSAAG